jgi:hypothetical protein
MPATVAQIVYAHKMSSRASSTGWKCKEFVENGMHCFGFTHRGRMISEAGPAKRDRQLAFVGALQVLEKEHKL